MHSHGGKRKGSGRPPGTGRYGVATKVIRVPEDKVDAVLQFVTGNGFTLPLYGCSVKAGVPSPSDDHVEQHLDLNTYLIQHPETTFYARVAGDSMVNAGIADQDLLIVDRSLKPAHGKIVIAVINGEMTVKRLQITAKGSFLKAENPDYPLIAINQNDDVHIWGVVVHVIKSL